MSAMFRTVAASTKTISQALAIAGVLVLVIVIYTGYTIPRAYMHPWFKWLTWINPLAYAFEALMVNEFHGQEFPCARFFTPSSSMPISLISNSFVPSYPNLTGGTFICSIPGAIAGHTTVSGDAYVEASFQYSYSHIWRNLGVVIAFWIFFLAAYLLATALNSSTSSTVEVLLFLRGHGTTPIRKVRERIGRTDDQLDLLAVGTTSSNTRMRESGPTSVLTWRDVVYDIHINGEPRRLLDHVSEWVKPSTLTALMGVSGAGKTTLLDVLAQRTSVGVVTGDILVDGKPLESSFQRRAGTQYYSIRDGLLSEMLIMRQAMCNNRMSILRPQQSVKRCVLVPCYGSLNQYRQSTSTIMWKR